MRVTLIRVVRDDGPLVLVTGGGISGVGLWRGEVSPLAGTEADIELDIPGEVDWRDVTTAPNRTDAVAPADDGLLLQGIVKDFDQEHVLTLRVGDGVVFVDTIGEPPLGLTGKWVHFVARNAGLYPTGT